MKLKNSMLFHSYAVFMDLQNKYFSFRFSILNLWNFHISFYHCRQAVSYHTKRKKVYCREFSISWRWIFSLGYVKYFLKCLFKWLSQVISESVFRFFLSVHDFVFIILGQAKDCLWFSRSGKKIFWNDPPSSFRF